MMSSFPCSADVLERYGRWLISIPRDDAQALQQTVEYQQFCSTFERLCYAHQRLRRNRNLTEEETTSSRHPMISHRSFLQHAADDDVVLRIFEFLQCAVLCRMSSTCHRLRDLAHRSAEQRSNVLSQTRALSTCMQMLRAQEQIDGVMPYAIPFVQVPTLGLKLRVLVTDSGDDEYNGVYFCTNANGNGYVFTKPRAQSYTNTHIRTHRRTNEENPAADNHTNQNLPLRCLISKRFSEQTLLWYMSKELERSREDYEPISDNNHSNNNEEEEEEQHGEEEFSFYANLMIAGWAPPGMSHYPSQTSVLSSNGDSGWQSLAGDLHPPTVELLQ